MRVLISGGTGFAGQALIRHLLANEPGVRIAVASRTATQVPGAGLVVTGSYPDLCRSTEFRRALADLDAIVHLGDGLSALQEQAPAAGSALADRLVAASGALAAAAGEAGLPLFIYVSSIKALCDEEDDRLLVEDAEPRGSTPYGQAKFRLEKTIADALARTRTRLAIVRNPVTYGQGKAGSLHRLLRLADTPFPLPLARIANKRSLLAVGNFASALAAIVRAGPASPGGVFHVHDGPALSTSEIVTALRTTLGRPPRLFAVSPSLIEAAKRIGPLAPIARRLYGSLQLSDTRFRQTFNWSPPTGTMAALAEMARRS